MSKNIGAVLPLSLVAIGLLPEVRNVGFGVGEHMRVTIPDVLVVVVVLVRIAVLSFCLL